MYSKPMPGAENGWLAALSVITSALLVLVTYSQFRIQSREFRPDLSAPKVAHYSTVAGERKTEVDERDIKDDEILFEVSNLGSGTATRVRAESKLWVLEPGNTVAKRDPNDGTDKSNAEVSRSIDEDGGDSKVGEQKDTNRSEVSLSEFRIPRALALDVTREEVYHSDWTETMEETIPGDQSSTGYVTRLHVQSEDRQLSLDEVLGHDFPEKSALRLKMRLVYTGRIEFRDRFSPLIDSVIFPGICDNLEETMAAEIPYTRYKRKSHTDALLTARADIESHRQSEQDTNG